MTPPKDTPMPPVSQILTGHFHETRGYDVWRGHGVDSWLLIYTEHGQGRFGRGGSEWPTRAGDIVLLRPNTCHDDGAATQSGTWDLIWSHFIPRPHWREWLAWPEVAPGLMQMTLREPLIRQKIIARLLETHRLATGALRQREVFAMNALEEVLLWCGTQHPRSEQVRMDGRVRECMNFLCHHLDTKVTLDGLAERAGLSVSRLAHLFREQVGMTPHQFLEQQRLERARQLLELSGRSIGDIAGDVGFDNPFYFTLRFKKLTGCSPRDYRRRILGRG